MWTNSTSLLNNQTFSKEILPSLMRYTYYIVSYTEWNKKHLILQRIIIVFLLKHIELHKKKLLRINFMNRKKFLIETFFFIRLRIFSVCIYIFLRDSCAFMYIGIYRTPSSTLLIKFLFYRAYNYENAIHYF